MNRIPRVFCFFRKPWLLTLKRWQRLDASGKLYFMANALLPAVLIGMLSLKSSLAATTVLLFAVPILALTSAGFVVWALSTLRNHPLSRHPTMIAIGIQALLIPLCVSLAQKIVSGATGFPGTAFELTTGFLTVLLIPFAWALVLFVIAAIAMAIGTIWWALVLFVYDLVLPLRHQTATALQLLNTTRDRSRAIGQHALGFLVTTMFVLFGAFGLATAISTGEVVRLIAYALDFGLADKYPGIDHHRPMKLLENNVVVYAKRTGLAVVFAVESVQPTSSGPSSPR